jgi:hypothetical protein
MAMNTTKVVLLPISLVIEIVRNAKRTCGESPKTGLGTKAMGVSKHQRRIARTAMNSPPKTLTRRAMVGVGAEGANSTGSTPRGHGL